jgi:hypothetical protein
MSKFNQEIHVVLFNSCLENEIMHEAFMKQLNKEYNTAPLLFLTAAKEFQKLEEKEEIIEAFKNIYEKYFKSECSHELNISGVVKKKIVKKYENIQNKVTFTKEKNLIDDISVLIKQELHLDSVIF